MNDDARDVGATLWLTGLSGAGKTTIADAVAQRLRENGRRVEVLDGDEIREGLSAGLGFSREDRSTHVRRVGFLADLLARNGVIALVPVIAPYEQDRTANRARHEHSGAPYLEIHVATSLAECERRDVKGLYAKARSGALSGMTGIDDPYEVPAEPELTLMTAGRSVSDCADEVIALLAGATSQEPAASTSGRVTTDQTTEGSIR